MIVEKEIDLTSDDFEIMAQRFPEVFDDRDTDLVRYVVRMRAMEKARDWLYAEHGLKWCAFKSLPNGKGFFLATDPHDVWGQPEDDWVNWFNMYGPMLRC